MDKREKLVTLYRNMVRVRLFETKLSELFHDGHVPGFHHSGVGQEAIPVGALLGVRRDDYMMMHHRGFGYCICKGMTMREIAAEMCGRATGCSRGKGGFHVANVEVGAMGISGSLGACFPISVGIGLTIRRRKTDRVVICFFGEGTSNRGPFHSALNMASLWKLPIIFVCENNGWAITVPKHRALSVEWVSERAAAYRMPGVTVDGNDVLAVHEACAAAIERARRGEGPSLVEGHTYRWRPHGEGYPYFGAEDDARIGQGKCPIRRLRATMLTSGLITEEELKAIDAAAQAEVDDAAQYALSSPFPQPEEALTGLYA